MKTLVCLPTYNEEENIEYMLNGLLEEKLDVVVCDGHSSDKTVDLALKLDATVVFRKGFGKGSAIIDTTNYALANGYDKVVTIDCDRTYDYKDINRLIALSNSYDMVVAEVRPPGPAAKM